MSQDYELGAYWFRKAAEQGNAYGQSNLGECYEKGFGVLKDKAQAAYWYQKAAEQGFGPDNYLNYFVKGKVEFLKKQL